MPHWEFVNPDQAAPLERQRPGRWNFRNPAQAGPLVGGGAPAALPAFPPRAAGAGAAGLPSWRERAATQVAVDTNQALARGLPAQPVLSAPGGQPLLGENRLVQNWRNLGGEIGPVSPWRSRFVGGVYRGAAGPSVMPIMGVGGPARGPRPAPAGLSPEEALNIAQGTQASLRRPDLTNVGFPIEQGPDGIELMERPDRVVIDSRGYWSQKPPPALAPGFQQPQPQQMVGQAAPGGMMRVEPGQIVPPALPGNADPPALAAAKADAAARYNAVQLRRNQEFLQRGPAIQQMKRQQLEAEQARAAQNQQAWLQQQIMTGNPAALKLLDQQQQFASDQLERKTKMDIAQGGWANAIEQARLLNAAGLEQAKVTAKPQQDQADILREHATQSKTEKGLETKRAQIAERLKDTTLPAVEREELELQDRDLWRQSIGLPPALAGAAAAGGAPTPARQRTASSGKADQERYDRIMAEVAQSGGTPDDMRQRAIAAGIPEDKVREMMLWSGRGQAVGDAILSGALATPIATAASIVSPAFRQRVSDVTRTPWDWLWGTDREKVQKQRNLRRSF